MQKSILLSALLLSMISMTYADELDAGNDFTSLLDNASEIATKKSLNVDYLPSVVTIIDASTYTDAGIQTIAEALDMLPGIQMQLSPTGYTMTTVRGLKNPNAYLSDKIKILIDGVAINNEVLGSSHFYMDFPMQLVDKIEVLRGPNSTLYGAGAFYGTINIITKLGNNTNENQLFAGAGSYQYRIAGANVNATAGDWKLFADGYYKQNNKGLDAYNVNKELGQTDEAMKDFSVGFKATNGGFEFLTRLKQNTYGNFYSYETLLNPIPNRDEGHTNNYLFSQLSYKTALNDSKLEMKANFSRREHDITNNMTDITTIAGFFNAINIDMQEGFYTHEKLQEENFEAEAILTFPQIKSNDVLMGVGIRQVNITKDEFYSSVENAIIQNNVSPTTDWRYNPINESAFWTNPTTTLLPKNTDRTIGYGYIQDLISVSDDIDLVLGLRADDYSDYGTQWSKRAGLVYRASDTTIFKLLYGSAFRVPTLIEAYQNGHINTRAGDSTIVPEKTDTYEAVAIFMPNLKHKISLNLFYSQLKNIIDLEEFPYTDPGYQNFKERYSQGVEFEYFFKMAHEHNLYFNATYLDTQYTLPSEPPIRYYGDGTWAYTGGRGEVDICMPDISKVMLKGMYVYRPSEKLSLGTTWKYFSQTSPTQLVTKDTTVDESHIFDETVTYRFSSSSELQLVVKNIFDAAVYQPSYYYQVDGGIRREGRNFLLNFTQKF